MTYEWPGYFIVFMLGFFFLMGPVSYLFPPRFRNILLLALIFRFIGSLARHWVVYGFYEGGDAISYYNYGLQYAESIWSMDFSFLDPSNWRYNRWWGTQTFMFISGFVVSLIGPTIRGEFLFFSLISLCGLLFFCKSFIRNFPYADGRKYAKWVLFWPSLCFWPSSTGKDAVILFTSGLVVYGYAGKVSKIQWIWLLAGIVFAGIIRPHVAGVMIVSVAIAHWITPGHRRTALYWVEAVGIVVLSILVVRYGFSNLGLEDYDLDSVREYVEYVSDHSMQGGSKIQTPGLSLTGIPLGFVNILLRPFPWELGNPLVAAAAMEMLAFWILVVYRRRRIAKVMMEWRSNRLLRLAIPLTLLYVTMLGVAVGNLGIIARQRIHIMPLLLIWLEALPQEAKTQQPRGMSRAPLPQRTIA